MYKYFKKLLTYFRAVEIYEKNSNIAFKCPKKYKFEIYRNLSNIKKKEILNYFKINKNKKNDFIIIVFF